MEAATQLLDRFVTYIIDPAILIIFGFGFFLFMWGLVQFLWGLGDDARGNSYTEGKQHMLWGIIGMLIMVSVYGIISLIDDTLDLDFANPDLSRMNNITAPVDFGVR